MPVFHTDIIETNTSTPSALQRLHGALTKLWSQREALEDFESFEREVHALFAEAEREVLAEGLERLDIDLPQVVIEGQVHRRVLRSPETYTTAVGSVTVTRTLYRTDKDAQAVVPLELRAGIVAGHWTALAARQATFLVAHLTPQETENVLRELGNMTPSKSGLDRLPKRLSERWEEKREGFEGAVARTHRSCALRGAHPCGLARWGHGGDERRPAR